MCLAILVPSLSFGITQDQYLLLVAKSLYNQVEKLKQEQFYANIFKFMNKKAKVAPKAVEENGEKPKAQLRNGSVTFDCVKRQIADKVMEKIEKEYPEEFKNIDQENHKTVLWRCMVNVEGEGEYNSLLHCRENCGYVPLNGFEVEHNDNEITSIQRVERLKQQIQIKKAEHMPAVEEEIVEDEMIEEGIIEEEIVEDKPETIITKWTIGEDGFCRKSETGEFDNYGECIKEAKIVPVKKEAPVRENRKYESKVFNWFLNALGIK